MAGQDGRSRAALSLVGKAPDLEFYAQRAVAKGGPVLVLGCAQGKLVMQLAEAGLQVLGADPSERMIQAAQSQQGSLSPEVASRIQLMQSDLRTLRVAERFAVVLAPQNALGLGASLDDLDALLATVRHHLAKDGLVVFDVLNLVAHPRPHAMERTEPTAPVEPPRPLFTPHLRERGDGGLRRLKLRAFSTKEIDSALARVGLVALERFGSFDGRPAEPNDVLQIVVAGEQ